MKTKKIILILLTTSISAVITPIFAINEKIYSAINSHNTQPKIPIVERDEQIPAVKIENQSWSTKKKIAVAIGVSIIVAVAIIIKEIAQLNFSSYYRSNRTNAILNSKKRT